MLRLALASFIASILHCHYNNNNELHRDVHIECTNWQTTSTFESKRNEKNPNNSWIQHLTHDEIKINIKMCTMEAATGWATATKSDKKNVIQYCMCYYYEVCVWQNRREKNRVALCHCHTNNRVFFRRRSIRFASNDTNADDVINIFKYFFLFFQRIYFSDSPVPFVFSSECNWNVNNVKSQWMRWTRMMQLIATHNAHKYVLWRRTEQLTMWIHITELAEKVVRMVMAVWWLHTQLGYDY